MRITRILGKLSLQEVLVLTLALLVLGAGIWVVGEHYLVRKTKTDEASLIARAITTDDHVVGDVHAPVQMIVYADLSCNYCKRFVFQTMPRLQTLYGNNIVFTYRHLPLASHPNSFQEAEAAECVATLGGNDAFWRFVKAVLSDPAYESGLNLSSLGVHAEGVGILKKQFTVCMDSHTSDARVERDALEASVAGITQTPSVVFKSATRALIVQGDYYNQFTTAIQYLLDATSSPRE